MGAIIFLNRRTAFFLTFVIIFFGWLALHNMITGNNNYAWVEFILVLAMSVGVAFYVARRFPPVGRRLYYKE